MSITNSKLLVVLKTHSRVSRNSKAEEKDRGTDIPSGFSGTHLASALGKKDMSKLRRKVHYD